jgi:hypothetical protein
MDPQLVGKIETAAQQLRRREKRSSLIMEAVQMQLGNCSGRLHLPCRFINDAECLFILRAMPLTGVCLALVTRLVLDSNKITSVHELPWPPSLTHISLSNNLLTSVQDVRWPPHLRCLKLDCNAIECAASSSSSSSSSPPSRGAPRDGCWPTHLTVLDLGRNNLSGSACVEALEGLLPGLALEQICIYNNKFSVLELFTALLAKGYPQPTMQQAQNDMNAVPPPLTLASILLLRTK